MDKIRSIFAESSKELKKVQVLAACAMFAALAIILSSVATINLGPYIRIGFSAIPNQLVDYLFGPITGCLFAGILDIVKYFIRPDGAFFFGFTFDAMLGAFIYGCFYYKRKLSLWRILAAEGTVAIIVNMFFNTLWLSILYGKGFFVLLPARVLKNVIMWPVNSLIFFMISKLIEQTGVFRIFRNNAVKG